MIPAESIGWMRDGEALLARAIGAAAALDAPSRLPGWDRATLVSHVASNATALANLLRWAATGVETPMYASPQAREDEIAQWRSVEMPVLLNHFEQTRQELDEAVSSLPDRAWDHQVRTNSARIVAASFIPWMRVREVYIHAVDLGAGTTVTEIPAEVRTAMLDEVVQFLSARPHCPVRDLRAGTQRWQLGDAGAVDGGEPKAESEFEGVQIEGADTALLAWLIGRSDGADLATSGPLPVLPRWL